LILVFVIGTTTTVNIGVLALVASLLLGTLLHGDSPAEVLAGFPGDLFLLVFGVTYLFGIATVNGTMELLVQRLVRLVGGRRRAVPPALFVVTFAAVSMGAVLPALSAVIGGLSLGLAQRLGIRPILNALMVLFGGIAGSFSPITLLGTIVNSTLARNGIAISAVGLYLTTFGFSCVLAVVAYLRYDGVWSGRRVAVAAGDGPGAAKRPAPASGEAPPDDKNEATLPMTPARCTTLLGIVALAVGLLGFGLDVGMLATIIAVVLQLAHQSANKDAFKQISWPVLVMICGVVTYIDLLNRAGTIKATGALLGSLGSPVLAAFLLCLISAAFSAVGSSAAIITAAISLALPLLAGGGVGALGFAAAIAISATTVDICPISSSSALVVASAPAELRDSVYRGLMRWSLAMVVIAPVVSTAVLVLPGWL
jgi:di/tricarboxylate transporter